jgi:hypothetical protein
MKENSESERRRHADVSSTVARVDWFSNSLATGAAENAGRDPYADDYEAAPYAAAAAAAAAPPAAAPGGYGAEPGYYQQAPGFPPPPGTVPNQYPPQPQYAAPGAQYAPPPNQAEYNPANFPPPPGTVPPPVPPANYNEAFASGANMDPYAPRTRRADENVSAAPSNGINSFPDQHYVPPSGTWCTSTRADSWAKLTRFL